MNPASSFYARYGKRFFDLIVVIPVIAAVWPLLLLIAIVIRATSRGPAFFRQGRLGRNAMVSEAWKFRTMTDKPRVPDTVSYSGDPNEVTAIGRSLPVATSGAATEMLLTRIGTWPPRTSASAGPAPR